MIWVVPSETPTILPSSTVATPGSSDSQTRSSRTWSNTSICISSPKLIVTSVLSKEILEFLPHPFAKNKTNKKRTTRAPMFLIVFFIITSHYEIN
ncbi:MAG TPA: hypothetical protein GX708_18970 [Gallicola sp.]|nr:hypothetical protein [Gallicola sp.]